jgi:hypothetical protein
MRIFLQDFEIIVRYEDFEYDYLIVQLLCFCQWRRLIHDLIQLYAYLISSFSETFENETNFWEESEIIFFEEDEITFFEKNETTYISWLWIEDMTRKKVKKSEKELEDLIVHDEDYKDK